VNQEFKQCLESKKIISFARGKNWLRRNFQSPKATCQMQGQAMKISDINGQLSKAIMLCSPLLERLSTPRATVKRATTA
jgi:hypothetical protein